MLLKLQDISYATKISYHQITNLSALVSSYTLKTDKDKINPTQPRMKLKWSFITPKRLLNQLSTQQYPNITPIYITCKFIGSGFTEFCPLYLEQ